MKDITPIGAAYARINDPRRRYVRDTLAPMAVGFAVTALVLALAGHALHDLAARVEATIGQSAAHVCGAC